MAWPGSPFMLEPFPAVLLGVEKRGGGRARQKQGECIGAVAIS